MADQANGELPLGLDVYDGIRSESRHDDEEDSKTVQASVTAGAKLRGHVAGRNAQYRAQKS